MDFNAIIKPEKRTSLRKQSSNLLFHTKEKSFDKTKINSSVDKNQIYKSLDHPFFK